MATMSVLDMLSNQGVAKGRVLWALQRSDLNGRPALRRLAEDLTRAPVHDLPTVPQHPAQVASREVYRRDAADDLTAVELAWLQRLPLDPEKVSFDDAARLAALSESVSATKAPASARLVASVWDPVRAVHDKRQAEARLEQARVPMLPVPATAEDALVESLAAQHSQVSEAGLRAEARNRLETWKQSQSRAHAEAIEQAEENLAEVDQRIERASDTSGQVA